MEDEGGRSRRHMDIVHGERGMKMNGWDGRDSEDV